MPQLDVPRLIREVLAAQVLAWRATGVPVPPEPAMGVLPTHWPVYLRAMLQPRTAQTDRVILACHVAYRLARRATVAASV